MGAVFLYVVALCFALASSEVLLAGAASRSSGSYVISVDHQAAGEQPYPRGCNSKQVSINVGTGKAAVNYAFTADTGSAALLMTCKTPTSTANCGGSLPASSNYELTPAHTVTGSTCSVANTGIGCLLPDQQCFISEALTGDPGYYNINNGHIAQDTVTVQNVLSGGRLSFEGMFGCAEAYIKCTPGQPDCFSDATQCPAAGASTDSLFAGSCPGSGNGIEAGWTFNVGGAPSAMAVPEQIYQAGLISKKVTGMYGVLWDTGAYGQSTVPADAYDAFVAYWQAGYAAAKASADAKRYGWTIEPCASPSAMCGSNVPDAEHACFQITMPGSSSAAMQRRAKALASMYPASIDITLEGGAVAQLPTAFALSACSGSRNTATTAVAVCSYVQGASPVGGYFWLAGPWFMGRFVQFDSSAPAAGFPESTGTVYWSDPISSCSFSS